MFHQDKQNKKLHNIGLPMVLYSGFIFCSLLALPSPDTGIPFQNYLFPLNFSAFLIVATLLPFGLLDKKLAFFTFFWVFPLFVLANITFQTVSLYLALPFAALIQYLGWHIPVAIGHKKLEGSIIYNNQEVSSNIYFHKYMFCMQNVGRPTSLIDAWYQFTISLFYLTLEAFSSIDYINKIQQDVDLQMQYNLKQLADGNPIYK